MRRVPWRAVVAGAVLFALAELVPAEPPQAGPTVLSLQEERALEASFLARHGRPPDAQERAALRAARRDEEVLVREALARGLHRDDPVVLRRLVDGARFLDPGSDVDASERVEAALALGLETHDPVVRRRLVNRMRLRLAEVPDESRHAAPMSDPVRWDAAPMSDPVRWRAPDRVIVAQRFLGRDDEESRARGAQALAALARDPAASPDAWARPAPFAHRIGPADEAALARTLGPGFAAAAAAAEEGTWQLVASRHGLHLLRVEVRLAGEVPPRAAVSARIAGAARRRAESQALAQALETLRARHPVVWETAAREARP